MSTKHKLILIAGPAGAGKTTIGKHLSTLLQNCIYIDKDTITEPLTNKLLIEHGSSDQDRESQFYKEQIRGIEYLILMNQAFENLYLNKNVVCTAPFRLEFNDKKWIEDVSIKANKTNAELINIWVYADKATIYERMVKRGLTRDLGKINDWENYHPSIKNNPPENIPGIKIINNTTQTNIPIKKQLETLFQFTHF
jgi:predicted kinase